MDAETLSSEPLQECRQGGIDKIHNLHLSFMYSSNLLLCARIADPIIDTASLDSTGVVADIVSILEGTG
jgi:hypothetical protein